MLNKPFVLLFFVLLLLVQQGHAQMQHPMEVQMEAFNNKDGLSQGFVSSIIQDHAGFLWFATKDGLNRYDGYHVTVYRNNPGRPFSLPDNSISQLAEDNHGNFWVGTRNKGLFYFDRIREQFYPVKLNHEDQLVNNPVQFLQVRGDRLLVEDYYDICIYDIRSIYPRNCREQLEKQLPAIFCYTEIVQKTLQRLHGGVNWMEDHSIWKASEDSVFIWRPTSDFKRWSYNRLPFSYFGMSHQRMFACFPTAEKHQLLLVGSDDISIFDTLKSRLIYHKILNASKNPPLDYFANTPYLIRGGKLMYYDTDGYHLFDPKTYADRLYLVDPKTAKTGFGGLSHLIDRDGVLWTGSIGYGIYKYNNRTELFNTYPEDCKSFFETADQQLVVNFRSGAATFDPRLKTKYPFTLNGWKPGWNLPIAFCKSQSGYWWLQVSVQNSAAGKLLQYNPATRTVKEIKGLLDYEPGAQLLAMFADRSHQVWQLIYSEDRSRKFLVADETTGALKAVYTIPQQRDVNRVSSFMNSNQQDAQGNFWFSTNRGLLFFNPQLQQWREYKNNPKDTTSLSSDIVFSTCPDPAAPNRYLWVGTNGGGLNKIDIATGKCKRYSEKNGLPNDVIYGILPDEFGNLWLSTNQGLSCFLLHKNLFRNYTNEDGPAGNEFNRGQFYKAADGTMYFGGVDGLTWFKPVDLLNAILPENRIVLTQLSIFNKPVDPFTDSSILKAPLQYSSTITLPYEKNMITLEFALLQYCQPERKQYKYFLEGFDRNWIDNGTKNSATYTNLDPGTYHFYVKGRNSDGVWTEQGATLTIIITPPWYRTWWFRVLVTLLFFGTVYGIYRYRLQQSLKLIGMRNNIASDLHDEIGSTISSISVYSDILAEKIESPDLKMIAGRISESSRNILVVMSDIVWSINPKNDRFDNVLIRMKSFAHEVLDIQNKQLHFEADEKLNHLKLHMNNRKNFYLIFKEALNNVVKYAQATDVWISVQMHGNEIQFSIRDNGRGFDLNELKEGNGIHNMQRRSRDLGGRLHIETAPGKGTLIRLRFPVMS